MRTVSKLKKSIFSTVMALGVAGASLGLMSCGSASNNDQGTGFTAYGFFNVTPEGEVEPDVGVSALFAPQSFATDPTGTGVQIPFMPRVTAIGVQNNLDGQTIRVQRAAISYIIPGASAQPPDTTTALNFVLAPSTNSGSALPDQGDLPTQVVAGFVIIPNEIYTWLILNRQSLPEPPFTVEAVVSVRGITSSGNVLDTNALTMPITIIPDLYIVPTDGSSVGGSDSAEGIGSAGSSSSSSGETAQATATPAPTGEQPVQP